MDEFVTVALKPNLSANALHEASKDSSEIFGRQHDPDKSERRNCFGTKNDSCETSHTADHGCRNQRCNATTENDAQLLPGRSP
jgi:hypothetical protein